MAARWKEMRVLDKLAAKMMALPRRAKQKEFSQRTCNSAYGASGKLDNKVPSSSAASTAISSDAPDVLRESLCEPGGMPVTVSSLVLSWLMDHDGVMRRSAAAFSEITCRGISAIALASLRLPWMVVWVCLVSFPLRLYGCFLETRGCRLRSTIEAWGSVKKDPDCACQCVLGSHNSAGVSASHVGRLTEQ